MMINHRHSYKQMNCFWNEQRVFDAFHYVGRQHKDCVSQSTRNDDCVPPCRGVVATMVGWSMIGDVVGCGDYAYYATFRLIGD